MGFGLKKQRVALSKLSLLIFSLVLLALHTNCASSRQEAQANGQQQQRDYTQFSMSDFAFGDLTNQTVQDNSSVPQVDDVFVIAQNEADFEPNYGNGSGSGNTNSGSGSGQTSTSGSSLPSNCIPESMLTQYYGGNFPISSLPVTRTTSGGVAYACFNDSFMGTVNNQLAFAFVKLLVTMRYMGDCLAHALDLVDRYLTQAPYQVNDLSITGLALCSFAAFTASSYSMGFTAGTQLSMQGLEDEYALLIDGLYNAD